MQIIAHIPQNCPFTAHNCIYKKYSTGAGKFVKPAY